MSNFLTLTKNHNCTITPSYKNDNTAYDIYCGVNLIGKISYNKKIENWVLNIHANIGVTKEYLVKIWTHI